MIFFPPNIIGIQLPADIYFLIIAILTGVWSSLSVVLIHISLVASEVRPYFHVLLCHLYIFWKKCLLKLSAHFLFGLFDSLLLSVENSLYILDISPLSGILAKIFSQSVTCHFVLLRRSFEEEKFLIFRKSSLSIYSCAYHAFAIMSQNSSPNPKSLQKILHFIFRSVMCLGLIFV